MKNKLIISIIIILTMLFGGSIYLESNNNRRNNKIDTSYEVTNKNNSSKTSLEKANISPSAKLESEAVVLTKVDLDINKDKLEEKETNTVKKEKEILNKDMLEYWTNELGITENSDFATRLEFLELINYLLKVDDDKTELFLFREWYNYGTVVETLELHKKYKEAYILPPIEPTDNLTREKACQMLYNILYEFEFPEEEYKCLEKIKDKEDISSWSIDELCVVVEKDLIDIKDGYLRPKENITRLEMLKLLDNAFGLIIYNEEDETKTIKDMTIKGNATIIGGNITLENVDIEGNLAIAKPIKQGDITFKNVNVKKQFLLKIDKREYVKVSDINLNGKIIKKEEEKYINEDQLKINNLELIDYCTIDNLITNSTSILNSFITDCFHIKNEEMIVKNERKYYLLKDEKLQNYEDFKKYLRSMFSEQFTNRLLKDLAVINVDGKVYALSGDGFQFAWWECYQVTLKSIEEDKIIYNAVPFILYPGDDEWWYTKTTKAGDIVIEDDFGGKYILAKYTNEIGKEIIVPFYTIDYTMTLINENGNWVIDSFLYYDKRGR